MATSTSRPRRGPAILGTLVLAVALGLAAPARAHDEVEQGFPPGFVDDGLVSDLDQATAAAFAPGGVLFVAEKRGTVWAVEDGVKSAQPVLDISEEVGNWGGFGLTGLAVDPGFGSNGWLYLIYVVDRHHLLHFGTPAYDPGADESFDATIGRVTRFTVGGGPGAWSASPASRKVLLGTSPSDGFPVAGTHGTGALRFGEDGSLLASAGDGAEVAGQDTGGGAMALTGLADGILTPAQDVGAFRSQLVDCLAGKILRLDPSNGDGLASNPFFVAGDPRAARSRVWTYGVRQPWRFSVIPGSSTGPDHPGVLLVGDVGAQRQEELNVVRTGGLNLGWPLFEGLEPMADFTAVVVPNLDAPNPLAGGGCEAFFSFQDLVVQDALTPPAWPNPCDGAQTIPASAFPSRHTRPALEWPHGGGPARVGVYDGQGQAATVALGDPACPVAGDPFHGNCAIGGAWVPSSSVYPAAWREAFYIGDYVEGWIRRLDFDQDHDLVAVEVFGQLVGQVIDMAVDPSTGTLHYLDLESGAENGLHAVPFFADDQPPTAAAAVSPVFGPGPLRVQFDAAGSVDPEGQALVFEWDFGDGTPPLRAPAPDHFYPAVDVTPLGTPIALVKKLVPPQEPTPGLPFDMGVIQDGVFLPLGSTDLLQTWSSLYLGSAEKGPVDWFGYDFAGALQMLHTVVFQEGLLVPGSGGWFESVDVEVRRNGVWSPVDDLEVHATYTGDDGTSLQTTQFTFTPVAADAVRLVGPPGGPDRYVNVTELRVYGLDASPPTPQRFDVVLTVSDPVGLEDDRSLPVWLDDTPPVVQITSPAQGLTYDSLGLVQLPLAATLFDAEHAVGELSCTWQTVLHHEDHVHPEPFDGECSSSTTLVPHGLIGERLWTQVHLEVSDPLGLSTAATSILVPEQDCNLNGVPDVDDIAAGTSSDVDLNGLPDECQADCDASGLQDAAEIAIGLVPDTDADGVPDTCETCQVDLGFAGPGALALAICGDDLSFPGSLATFRLSGIEAGSSTLLVLSLESNPTSVKGGTLVPFPWLILSAPLIVGPGGEVVFDLPGAGGSPFLLYVQAVSLLPGNEVHFSNALEVLLGAGR